jgi:hypothetical protein
MSNDSWIAGPGDWSVGSTWSSGSVPISASDVTVDNVGSGASNAGVTIDAQTAAVANSVALNSSTLTDAGSLTVGGNLMLDASYFVLEGGSVTAQSISGGGTFGEISGYGAVTASLASSVTFDVAGGVLTINGAVNSGDSFYINADSTLELVDGGPPSIAFEGADATLRLDAPSSFTGTIQDVQPTNVLDLRGVAATSVSYNGSTLTVDYDYGGQVLTLNVSGSLAGDRARNYRT